MSILSPKPAVPQAGFDNLTLLLQLESEARQASEQKAFEFFVVNETRRLLPYRQGVLLAASAIHPQKLRVSTISSLAVVESDAPMVQWLERTIATLMRTANDKAKAEVKTLTAESVPSDFASGWQEYSLPYVAWVPLWVRNQRCLGGLWLARETAWQSHELLLLKRLGETYAHAWDYIQLRQPRFRLSSLFKHGRWILFALFFMSIFIPVRLTTLAPVEVIAQDPAIISAPMDGVVASIFHDPNSPVQVDEVVWAYDDTTFRNHYSVAEQALAVSIAEYRKASQSAFADEKSKAEVALLKTKVELAAAERDYAKEVLSRVEVRALRSGLLIYSSKSDWIGRPLTTGERVMEIADPEKVKLRIDLPAQDAISIKTGADVKVFLDIDPTNALAARVTHASYKAERKSPELLAFRIDADFADNSKPVRIGSQGTAKIYGEQVSLLFYLLRRPYSSLRQQFGF